MHLSKGLALAIAVLLSFAVYVLPLWTVHAVFLVGPALLGALATAERLSATLILNLVAALCLQALLAAVLYFFLRRISLFRGFALVLSLPLLAVLGQVLFLLAVPAATLVSWARPPELSPWPVACRVEGARLQTIFNNTDGALEASGEAWVALPSNDPTERVFGQLAMPNCNITERLRVTKLSDSSRNSFEPNGAVLYWTFGAEPEGAKPWVLTPAVTKPEPLAGPLGIKYWAPLLSRDGSAIAWVVPQGGAVYSIVIRDLATGAEQGFDYSAGVGNRFELLDFDRSKGEIVAEVGRDTAIVLDLTGSEVRGPLTLEAPYRISQDFRWGQAGWLAASSALEIDVPVILSWDLAGAQGQQSLPKGRGLTALSITPDGRYLALSLDQSISLFSLDSAVVVLDSRTGKDVFRRYFPSYTRATVMFLGDSHLAFDHSVGGERTIEVLQIP